MSVVIFFSLFLDNKKISYARDIVVNGVYGRAGGNFSLAIDYLLVMKKLLYLVLPNNGCHESFFTKEVSLVNYFPGYVRNS